MGIIVSTIPVILNLIKSCESLRLKAYLCPSLVATIAYGATYYQDGTRVKMGDVITKNNAEKLFLFHISQCEHELNKCLRDCTVNINQFSALVSLVYNMGIRNFLKSPVYFHLKEHQYNQASQSFMNHVYSYNRKTKVLKKLPGLVTRRKKEIAVFNTRPHIQLKIGIKSIPLLVNTKLRDRNYYSLREIDSDDLMN